MDDTHRARRGFGFWAAMVIGAIIAIFGVRILGGGVWLAALGGSWYYILAGIGLVLTAFFLFRRSMLAVWVYLVTFAGTVAWALWEAGLDGWAQVPRLVAPTVVLVLVLATIPALRGRLARPVGTSAAAIAGGLALVGSLSVLTLSQQGTAIAQDAPAADEPAPIQETQAPVTEILPEEPGEVPEGQVPAVEAEEPAADEETAPLSPEPPAAPDAAEDTATETTPIRWRSVRTGPPMAAIIVARAIRRSPGSPRKMSAN